jgi:electron transport complex protein RnfC
MKQTELHAFDKPLSTFDGGLKLVDDKQLSTASAISLMEQCRQYTIPLQQHIGVISQTLVKPGDRVLKGQMLAQPGNLVSAAIHSPVSGVVTDIKPQDVPHISGLQDQCIIIENDFKDEWIERNPIADNYNQATSSDLRKIICEAGIVGLGGATFPSSVKQTEINIKTLILNGAECEPYITCDDVLMRERAEAILSGADIIGHIIKARQCVVAIEDNKPEAINAMQAAIEKDGTGFFRIQVIPTIYPSGGEKQLIKIITGKEVPKNRLPPEVDVLCHNVATAYAIHNAIYSAEPLISRITTITGHGVKQPQNIEVLIGTAMQKCIQHCGGYTDDYDELVMGGPMMGISLGSDTLPVIKATNCLLVIAKAEHTQKQKHLPCIRCAKCVDVCPARLLPQQLYWYASSKNIDRLIEYNLFDCIECGCCAYVCPSNIPLVQYYRYAKTTIWQQQRERKSSDIARQRHESHQQRLEKQKRERKEKLRKKRELLKNKTRDNSSDNTNNKTGTAKNTKQAVIAEAVARAQARKAEHNKTEKMEAEPNKKSHAQQKET